MPPIKLKINMGSKVNGTSSNPPSAAPRASPAPSTSSINSSIIAAHPMDPPTPGASLKKKNTIKFKPKSTPSTPLESIPQYPQPLPEPAPKKSKAGRTSKPSAKLVEANRKRVKDESDSDGEGSTIQVEQRAPNPSKKIKLSIGGGLKTPSVAVPSKIKTKGRPMQRKKGEGYDSEASDRELDPVIEEEFVLRMMPGDDCDYLRQMIADKKIGLSTRDGGADVRMKFFDQELRRVLIVIRGHMYAATLVDLPTIIEGMKSWDKRGWWKTADICQMLWVYARINREEEAKTLPLPKEVNPETHQYPHGLTPPMHYAQKRRFRKRISRTAIEAVEEAVNKLMAADDAADCIDTRFEMIDPDAGSRRPYSPGGSSRGDYDDGQEYSEDEDADGEVDDTGSGYFGNQNGITATPAAMDDLDALDALDADMEKELEAAFQEVAALESATPMSSGLAEGETPMNGVETPVGETPGAEDSGEDSVESGEDEEDEEDEEEIDEDEKARLAKLQTDKEDIADMERQLQDVQSALATQANPILKKRLEEQIRKIKAELQLKKSAMPEGEGADD